MQRDSNYIHHLQLWPEPITQTPQHAVSAKGAGLAEASLASHLRNASCAAKYVRNCTASAGFLFPVKAKWWEAHLGPGAQAASCAAIIPRLEKCTIATQRFLSGMM